MMVIRFGNWREIDQRSLARETFVIQSVRKKLPPRRIERISE